MPRSTRSKNGMFSAKETTDALSYHMKIMVTDFIYLLPMVITDESFKIMVLLEAEILGKVYPFILCSTSSDPLYSLKTDPNENFTAPFCKNKFVNVLVLLF